MNEVKTKEQVLADKGIIAEGTSAFFYERAIEAMEVYASIRTALVEEENLRLKEALKESEKCNQASLHRIIEKYRDHKSVVGEHSLITAYESIRGM